MPLISANLVTTGLVDVGYQFFNSAGTLLGSRITAGVTETPAASGVYTATATLPGTEIGVYWNSSGTALAKAYEVFDVRSDLVAASVWASGTRTLSSFGTLVADVATAVWGAATRTLSAFGFTVPISGDAATAGTRLLTMIELDGSVYQLTTNALENGPSGGGGGGSDFTEEQVEDVVAAATRINLIPETGPVAIIPAASEDNQTTGYLRTRDGQGALVEGITIHFRVLSVSSDGNSFRSAIFTGTSDEDGLLTVDLQKECTYEARRGSAAWVEFTTGDEAEFAIPSVLGAP